MISANEETAGMILERMVRKGSIEPFEHGGRMDFLNILNADRFRGSVERIGFIGGKFTVILFHPEEYVSGRWTPSDKTLFRIDLREFGRIDFMDAKENFLPGFAPGCHILLWKEPQEAGRKLTRSLELRLIPRN